MRSIPFLGLLGASFARGVSPKQRDLQFEERSKPFEDGRPGVVERHENGFLAAQYPLAQTNDHLIGKTSIDPNLDPEGITTVVETHIAQNSVSTKNNQADTHALLKRVPDYLTFNVPYYNIGFKTSVLSVDIPVTITVGTEAPVTLTKKLDGPVIVTVSATVTEPATSFINYGKTAFEFTVVPSGVTDEFLTFTYATVTRDATILQKIGRAAYTTLTSPVTVTILQGNGTTKTVTQTFTKTQSFTAYTFLPETTRTVAIVTNYAVRRPIVTTTDAELLDFTGFLWED